MKAEDTWFKRTYPDLTGKTMAYFSFEFGLHESLPVYAGGLGVLSGDHLKEASDLGMPLVAVGFFYNQGYFSQKITEDGWQETRNLVFNFDEMPIIPHDHPGWQPGDDLSRPARAQGMGAPLEGPGGAGTALPARQQRG